MKKTVRSSFALFFLSCFALSAQPVIQWERSLGGSKTDLARTVVPTPDKGFILAGLSASNDGDISGNHDISNLGTTDCWVAKLDSTGSISWQKMLGGIHSEEATSVGLTSDGGYIVAGTATYNDGDVTGVHPSFGLADFWVIRLDASGNIVWKKAFGGTDGDYAESVQQTADGGYIVGGASASNDGDVTGHHGTGFDYWVVKLDAEGNLVWQKSLGGTGNDMSSTVRQVSDGGYVVVGTSRSSDGDITGHHTGAENGDAWMVKLSPTGTIEWEKSLGGSGEDVAYAFIQTDDGGFALVGNTSSVDGDVTGVHGAQDMWVVKLSSTGSLQWQKPLGSTNQETGYALQQTSTGYLVGGMISGEFADNGDVSGFHPGTPSSDIWVVKLDLSGALQWQRTLGGVGYEMLVSLHKTHDEGIVVAGSNNAATPGNHGLDDAWIVKLSPEGPSGYMPFPVTPSHWTHSRVTGCFPGGGLYVFSYRFSGDTTAAGKAYQKLSVPYYQVEQPASLPCIISPHEGAYSGAIRQDMAGRKVYFLPPGTTTEKLLYDFTMQVGDTLKGYLADDANPWKVVSLDAVTTADGQLRKRWNLVFEGCSFDTARIVEGIGSDRGLLTRIFPCFMDGDKDALQCMSTGGNTRYLAPGIFSCALITATPALVSGHMFSLYPNPAEEYVQLTTDYPILSATLTDGLGRTVAVLPENGNRLNLSSWKAGLYYIKIHTAQGTAVQKVVRK